jgi:hypothetical protein
MLEAERGTEDVMSPIPAPCHGVMVTWNHTREGY